ADVRERRLDVGFIGVWPGQALEGVEYRLLAEEELVVVLPVEHPLAKIRDLSLAHLEDQPLVDFPAGTGARRQTDEAFAAAGLRHRVQFEVSNIRLVEKFVQRALAVGLVPARIASDFRDVVTAQVRDAPRRHLYVIWSKSPTPAARAFVHMIEQSLAARGGG
ncbi:MAG: LysR substrate-binding domain-containing protein, partial [Pseudomonas sp.]